MEFKYYKDKFKELEFEKSVRKKNNKFIFQILILQFILHKEHFKNSFFAFLVKP